MTLVITANANSISKSTSLLLPLSWALIIVKDASDNSSKQNYISFDEALEPLPAKKIESFAAKNASCTIDGCPIW
jgi:hypothetical protein